MHAHELVELAAVVSAQGPVLIGGNGQLSSASLQDYWTASKCRLDRWNRSLKGTPWPRLRGVLEEILTGEVLTRVWTAVVCVYDRKHGLGTAEPVVRNVLLDHLEVRRRVLRLLVERSTLDAGATVPLDRLRRRTERWTDLLVGYLLGIEDVSEFAIDPDRAGDFADDLRYRGDLPHGCRAWPLLLQSLRSAFYTGLCPTSPNPALNRRIAGAILSCFQPELLDSTGVFHALWLMRLTNAADDAEGLLAELLSGDPRPAQHVDSTPARLLSVR
jgi:hypothetical protein